MKRLRSFPLQFVQKNSVESKKRVKSTCIRIRYSLKKMNGTGGTSRQFVSKATRLSFRVAFWQDGHAMGRPFSLVQPVQKIAPLRRPARRRMKRGQGWIGITQAVGPRSAAKFLWAGARRKFLWGRNRCVRALSI
jgi:hypothetical protein